MEELKKLWEYLTTHHYNCVWYYYEYKDKPFRNQIIVYEDSEYKIRKWDAVCHYGTYGYENGLLEIYGEIVHPLLDDDNVVGFLTADEIINKYIPRLE